MLMLLLEVVLAISVVFTTRVGKDRETVSVTVIMLVVIAAAAVIVVRGAPMQEQAEEYASMERQDEA